MASTSGAGGGHRVLVEVLGAQIAWWQLGFAVRRAVLRDARRGLRSADRDAWDVGVCWAWQWLTAPRWWRVVRDVGSAVLAVVCSAALAHVMVELSGEVALTGAIAGCLPPVAWWLRRQGRDARLLVGTDPDADRLPDRVSGQQRAVHGLVVALVALLSATMLAATIGYDRSSRLDCPHFAVDAPVREWGERGGVGCPAGDTTTGATGVRYTPWNIAPQVDGKRPEFVVYALPDAGPVVILEAVFAVWTAEGGPAGRLGQPADSGVNDTVAYQNFAGGAVVIPVGGTPRILTGQRYSDARPPGSACVKQDRPCITAAHADADGIRVAWQYGDADAFNVAWWAEGASPESVTQREVAGYEFTVPDPRPATAYVVEVAACHKRFLRRSACTWPSARVLVRVD